jgi:hypothetical protein
MFNGRHLCRHWLKRMLWKKHCASTLVLAW